MPNVQNEGLSQQCLGIPCSEIIKDSKNLYWHIWCAGGNCGLPLMKCIHILMFQFRCKNMTENQQQ